jgi:CHAT domain-containing protein
LVAAVEAGEMLEPECPKCGRPLDVQPIRILREAARGPLLLVFSPTGEVRESSPEAFDLISGERPPTILHLPFEAAAVVLPRDVDRDLLDRYEPYDELTSRFGEEVAARYNNLLDMVEQDREEKKLGQLMSRLSDIDNAETFARFLEANPTAVSDEMLEYLQVGRTAAFEGSIGLVESLLLEARHDPQLAWQRYSEAVDHNRHRTPDLEGVQEQIDALLGQQEYDQIIDLVVEALPQVRLLGAGLFEGALRRHMAVALLARASTDRANDIEEAIRQFEAATPLTPPGPLLGDVLVNTAVAYAQRLVDDPRDNFDSALRALRDGLRQLDEDDDAEICATAHTNLARGLRLRERGKRLDNLREALHHAHESLRLRSPEKDADAWAPSQTNLGDVLAGLAAAGERNPEGAREAFQRVVAEQARISDPSVVGNAHSALAELLQREAAEHNDPAARRTSLGAADQHLEAAVALIDRDRQPVMHGSALAQAGSVRAGLGDVAGGIALLQEGLTQLPAHAAPRQSQQVAWELADLLFQAGRLREAGEAFRAALAAARLGFDARLYTSSQQAELRSSRNLARFAAYAIARAGDPQEAALVLEDGRTREMRRRLGVPSRQMQRLLEISPALHDAYANALAALIGSPFDDRADEASRDLQRALNEIRELPGLQAFGKETGLDDIRGAVEPGWPLVYVDPAPAGTMLLLVTLDDADELHFDAEFLDEPDGEEVALTAMAGDYKTLLANDRRPPGAPPSPLGTAAALTAGEIADALDYVLPWFGERIAKPINQRLHEFGAFGVSVVACGPLAVVPLHAAQWQTESGSACLLESFPVRYAPSAAVQAACLRRARERGGALMRLVALGDPQNADPDNKLDTAEAEVAEIASFFDCGRATVAIGPAANSAFFRQHATEASHLHLACHAETDTLDIRNSVLYLADVELALDELAAVGPLVARLTVASACQTALPQISDLPDEVFSIGTALVNAGSACAVASLWSVYDPATSLLMIRLYEELAADPAREPAVALRRAQLWLRGLSEEDEAAYLRGHPALQREFERLEREGEELGNRSLSATPGAPLMPWAHPDFWAAFMAVGA